MRVRVKVPVLAAQADVLKTTARHPAFIGGFGSGKSEAAARWIVQERCSARNAGLPVLLSSITIKQAVQTLRPRVADYLAALGIPNKFVKGDSLFQTPYGEIKLGGANSADNWRSDEFAAIGLDEAALYQGDYAFKIALGRTRQRGRVNRVALFTTPETHARGEWILNRYEGNGPNDPQYPLIKAKSQDNPYTSEAFLLDMEENYSPRLLQAYRDGEFVTLGGLVLADFTDDNLTDLGYEPGYETFWSVDFGYNRPSALLHQIRYDPELMCEVWVTVAELKIRERSTDHLARAMREYSDSLGIGKCMVYPDRAGDSRGSSVPVTDIDCLKMQGFEVQVCRNPYFLRIWVGLEWLMGWVLDGAGRRRYLVNRGCTELRKQIGHYTAAEATKRDNPYKHDIDSLRYVVINRLYPRSSGLTGQAQWRVY